MAGSSSSSYRLNISRYGVPAGSDCDTGHRLQLETPTNTISAIICYRSNHSNDDTGDPPLRASWDIQIARIVSTGADPQDPAVRNLEAVYTQVLPELRSMTPTIHGLTLAGTDLHDHMVLQRVRSQDADLRAA